VRSLTAECKDWLRQHLTENSHNDSRDVKRAGAAAGYSESTVNRARKALRVLVTALNVAPRRTVWSLPPTVSDLSNGALRARENGMTDMTDINAGQSVVSDSRGNGNGFSRSSDVMPPREVTRLDDHPPGADQCPTCPAPLDQHAAPGCQEPVIHTPADLWSTT
jgi:hypothetical protein